MSTISKDLLDRWIAALRSGTYNQGKTYLNADNNFCCLGVLCEVSEQPKEEGMNGIMLYGGRAGYLPDDFSQALNITGRGDFYPTKLKNQSLLKGKSRSCLTLINDSDEFTFSEIADLIEHIIECDAFVPFESMK